MNTKVILPIIILPSITALAHSATVIPINSFNPNTFFSGGVTAGLDFNDDAQSAAGNQYVTQSGFLAVPNSNNKTYNLSTGGVSIDIVVTNANLANENRWRGNATTGDPGTLGALIADFEQWHGSVANSPVEAAFTFGGLTANTDYEISFFTYNAGAGQTTHSFFEGASSASPLITTFTTAGNNSNLSTWRPGITIGFNTGASTTKSLTIQATQAASPGFDSRLTFNGLSIVPEPSSALLCGIGCLLLVRRRR